MADYSGTTSADTIDQTALGIPDWSALYGLAGNDTITIARGVALGGAGNDTIIASEPTAAGAGYFDAPAGVVADLQSGVVQDGWGGTDTLVGIRHLDRPWEFDSDATWLMFYPTLDALTGVPNDGPITFGHAEEPRLVTALSRTLWDPLLAQEATR